jgi:phospholipid/cholesterol/gamma-HCH transport system substrate-binding protein
MQTARLGAGLSRSMRQSAVGFLFLGSVALFIGLLLWLQNLNPARRSYRAFIEFSDAGGMTPGTVVAYRGVKVGRVVDIEPQPQGVVIEVELARADRPIPSNSIIEANQSGLVGETSINITPLEVLPSDQEIAGPLDPDCNPDLIICDGSRLQGEAQLDVNELIRSTLRIANLLSDPQFTANINSVARNASDALVAITSLSEDVSGLTNEVEQLVEGGSVENTLTSLGQAADEVRLLVATNRTALSDTLVSFQQSSDQLRGTLNEISLTVDEISPAVSGGNLQEIVNNLEVLSANAAEASANLRDFSTGINDPSNALMLQQLLDSARSVFQNVEKITADLDELTGDPAFRDNLRQLIDSLNRLVDASEQLERQTEVAEVLDSLTVAIDPATSDVTPTLSGSGSLQPARLEPRSTNQPDRSQRSIEPTVSPQHRQTQERQTRDPQMQLRQRLQIDRLSDRSTEQPSDRSESTTTPSSPPFSSDQSSSDQSPESTTLDSIPDSIPAADRSTERP